MADSSHYRNTMTGQQSNLAPEWHAGSSSDWEYVHVQPASQISSASPSVPVMTTPPQTAVRYDPAAAAREMQGVRMLTFLLIGALWAYLTYVICSVHLETSPPHITTGNLQFLGFYVAIGGVLVWAATFRVLRWSLGLLAVIFCAVFVFGR